MKELEEKKRKEQYRKLLNDPDFDKIELELRKPNIFQILRISRTEIRHSNFLAWLLSPNETHGLGKLFLINFLREVAILAKDSNLDILEIEKLNFNSVEIKREWKHIDLLIIFDKHVICIENKVDSQDHSAQLSTYHEIVKKNFKDHAKIHVYLTPTGEEPNEEGEGVEDYILFSYEKIIEHTERILDIYGKSINAAVYQYISDFLITLKRELTMSDTTNKLAENIYKNHKQLLDFIFANKPDIAAQLNPIFVKKIKESDWELGATTKVFIRFLPKSLNFIPKTGEGWQNKESFLFEFILQPDRNLVIFKSAVSPGNANVREILNNALSKIEGFRTPRGKNWLVHFQEDLPFDVSDMSEIDEAKVNEILNEKWKHVTDIVEKVEKELQKHKTKLLNYKE